MPKVLHVISGLNLGGAEMALYRLIAASCAGEYQHMVVALTPDGAMRDRFQKAGVEPLAFDFKRSPISEFLRLIFLIRRVRPDIVQTWMYHADLLGGLAARLAGIRPVIWGVHSTHLLNGGTSRNAQILRRLCAWASGLVPHTIVCVAEASKRAHMDVGYDGGRMVVVPNGFDLSQLVATGEQRSALRAQCRFGATDAVIGSLGRFNLEKDQKNFVRAAGLLARQNLHVRFLMVGPGLDAGNAELTGWIDDTGYRDRFVLLGARDDVPVCLAAMDVLCLHSRTEAFPLAVGEGMAMGLPCVVTDVGDAAMLVADTGIVVPKEDPASLAQGLARLLAMAPEQRRHLGQRARARIQAEFTMQRARERFETIYRQLMEKGGQ